MRVMMTETNTIDGGPKDALLKWAIIERTQKHRSIIFTSTLKRTKEAGSFFPEYQKYIK